MAVTVAVCAVPKGAEAEEYPPVTAAVPTAIKGTKAPLEAKAKLEPASPAVAEKISDDAYCESAKYDVTCSDSSVTRVLPKDVST